MSGPMASDSIDPDSIGPFRGEWYFLSNFSPAIIACGETEYRTVEHAYQAARCAHAHDREVIRAARSPGEAKRLGRAAEPVKNWAAFRDQVMLELLREKFRSPDMRYRLLSTGRRHLIELNEWGDTYWGVSGGVGENRLGKLLAQVREELAEAQEQH